MKPTKVYNLYLDETYANPKVDMNHFCLAGIIVEKDTYENFVIPKLEDLKLRVFGKTQIILHHSEVSRGIKEFHIFKKDEAKRTEYENGIAEILSHEEVHGLAVAIDEAKIKALYPNMKDIYAIGLQLVVENFVNFLERHNAVGNILMESRDTKADETLAVLFQGMKFTGTLFYTPHIISRHLELINFYLKADDIAGLQIADILPLILNRDLNNKRCLHPTILRKVKEIMCHADCIPETEDLHSRFGFKVLP